MKTKPIIFNTEMVQAISLGYKKQTRRLVPLNVVNLVNDKDVSLENAASYYCPYQPGDQLWVRETWSPDHKNVYPFSSIVYKADYSLWELKEIHEHNHYDLDNPGSECLACQNFKWRPSIHMKKRDSRITLEVTSVKIQRLQDITEDEALAEGCPTCDKCQYPWGDTRSRFGRGVRDDALSNACGGKPWHMCSGSCGGLTATEWFHSYWDIIYCAEDKDYARWVADPYVWVIEFERKI